jgi:hypothetical protein
MNGKRPQALLLTVAAESIATAINGCSEVLGASLGWLF